MNDQVVLSPETPGKDIPFIKPNIPKCWSPQSVVTEEEENA